MNSWTPCGIIMILFLNACVCVCVCLNSEHLTWMKGEQRCSHRLSVWHLMLQFVIQRQKFALYSVIFIKVFFPLNKWKSFLRAWKQWRNYRLPMKTWDCKQLFEMGLLDKICFFYSYLLLFKYLFIVSGLSSVCLSAVSHFHVTFLVVSAAAQFVKLKLWNMM